MGKLRSYLSQVQDFIANPISRNVMLNDLYQEALEVLFNDDKEPPKEAIVLKVFPQNQTTGDLKEGEEQFQSAILRVPKLHDCLPDPLRFMEQCPAGYINNSIQMHGIYFSREPLASIDSTQNPSALIKVGDIVPIEYIDKTIRFGAPIGIDTEYAKLQFVPEETEEQDKIITQKELQKVANEREAVLLGDATQQPTQDEETPPSNVIEELERKIPVTQEIIEYPSSLNFLTNRVLKESKIWKNKKEKDPTVYQTLKKYWDNVGWNERGGKEPTWTPSGVPWSAAYISWIVKDKFFPKSSAHYRYSESSLNNRIDKKGKWWLFSLKREKVKINIGDVFVKTRSDGSKKQYNNSHGDIVWKIENNIAYLTGGNLGSGGSGEQTMKTNMKISLNDDGTPKNVGKYTILVKRVE